MSRPAKRPVYQAQIQAVEEQLEALLEKDQALRQRVEALAAILDAIAWRGLAPRALGARLATTETLSFAAARKCIASPMA